MKILYHKHTKYKVNNMLYCKNCEYFREIISEKHAQCVKNIDYSRDLVYGKINFVGGGDFLSCEYARNKPSLCGKLARWYKNNKERDNNGT